MILEFDLGNTRGKWRLLQGTKVMARGVVDDDGPLGMTVTVTGKVAHARAVSVAGSVRNDRLAAWVLAQYGLELHFASAEGACAGVINGYAEPERLGVDRWAALIAAYVDAQADVLVVDAGTAMTLDVVTAAGKHQGGWILPGRRLALSGLSGHTAQISVEQADESGLAPGENTSQAVNRGIALAATGAIARVIENLPAVTVGYLTGGDAKWLAPMLPPIGGGWRHRDELVMDGLAYICRF